MCSLPTPTTALSRSYLCFFDADGTSLDQASPRCRLVLQEFADQWRRSRDGTATVWPSGALLPAKIYRVGVHGHDDAANPLGNAHQIALRRALSVTDELMRLGIPAELITTIGFDNSRLLVPTNDPEPQNRRVELLLR